MDYGFTDRQAITSAAVTLTSAIIGVCVAAGLDLSKNLTDAIIVLISAITPFALLLIGWLHHNAAKVTVARTMAESASTPTTTSVRP